MQYRSKRTHLSSYFRGIMILDYLEIPRTAKNLRELQLLPFMDKIKLSLALIIDFYIKNNENVYINYSGGIHSTVMLDLIRSIYPKTPALFSNAGMEYPEVLSFIKKVSNIEIIRPKTTFRECLIKYGYPVLGKRISHKIETIKRTPHGKTAAYFDRGEEDERYPMANPQKKLSFLIQSPFKCSAKCCNELKKKPIKEFTEQHNNPGHFIATLAEESINRKEAWLKTGYVNEKHNTCTPLSFWTQQDALKYIYEKNLSYCSLYGKIKRNRFGQFHTTGESGTGCMFCLCQPIGFIIRKDLSFYRLEKTYPKIYQNLMKPIEEGGLGYESVLSWIRINYLKRNKLCLKDPHMYDKYFTEKELAEIWEK